MTTSIKPWTTGPKELLDHAKVHLQEDSDFDRRIALISADNAVELMMIAYIEQPKRYSGVQISRRRIDDAKSSFPSLLDAMEEFASDRLDGIDLSEIEWYHRLRNQLYHGGVGLTVETQKVQVYLQLAINLFDSLFGLTPSECPTENSVSGFLTSLQKLRRLAPKVDDVAQAAYFMGYEEYSLILHNLFPGDYEKVRVFRNSLVHGTDTKSKSDLEEYRALVEKMISVVEEKLENK